MVNASVKHLVLEKCATLSTSDVDLSLSGIGAFHACHCASSDLIRQPFRQRHLAERTVVAPEPFTVRVLTIQCVCPSPPCSGFCGVAFTKHAETFRRTISRRSAAQVQRRRDKRCPLLTGRDQAKRCFRNRLDTHSLLAPRGPQGGPPAKSQLQLHIEFSWITRSRKMQRHCWKGRSICHGDLPSLRIKRLSVVALKIPS